MRDQDRGAGSGSSEDAVEDLRLAPDVELGGRFVEQDDARSGSDRAQRPGQPADAACAGAVARGAASGAFKKLEAGKALSLDFPAGLAARAVILVKIDQAAAPNDARLAGAAIAKKADRGRTLVFCDGVSQPDQIALGAALRSYGFDRYKSGKKAGAGEREICFLTDQPEAVEVGYKPSAAVAEGVCMARDLVNEPANILTTAAFAERLSELKSLGVDVTILEEPDLEKIGMRTLLAVGQGSNSASRVGILHWRGGAGDPLVLAGKGVVFDTGGISLKPAAKMELMTMDMAGAAVVAGVMRSVALRKAAANVTGIVGLVENMPSGSAQRPGDIVQSLKGDTVEVINTDAEGRLVLADILWHAQKEFSPSAVIDLATLTGAIVVSLGSKFAGAFSNDDAFCRKFIDAAAEEGERAWPMPLDKEYDKQLKSKIADMKNVGGRGAGAVTAAQFLQRFVEPDMPWIHLDIAGVAHTDSATAFAPRGATGWGMRAIDRLIRTQWESG